MKSATFENRAAYVALMSDYLNGKSTDEHLVTAFFGQRRLDDDRQEDRDFPLSPLEDEWEKLFQELFDACEDLTMFPGDAAAARPNDITAAEFHDLIAGLLPRFAAFRG